MALARESLDIQRERIEASQRPHVIPAPTREWIDLMSTSDEWADVPPVKKLRPGVAVNCERVSEISARLGFLLRCRAARMA